MTKLRHLRVPGRLGAGLALFIAIGAIVVIVLTVASPSPTKGASNGSQASGATAVQHRDLVETDTESGTLSYANPHTVYDRLSGTITWLPSIGQVIRAGQALYRVSGQPVVLMNGTTPAYRDLSAADSPGPDILQLNRDLVRLGYNPEGIVADDVWQPATAAAVEVFQESIGEPPTAVLTLGQVVFLPGEQVVSTLQATLGSTGGGSGSASGSAASDESPKSSSAEFVSLNTPTTQTGQTGPTNPPGTGRRAKGSNPKPLAALVALLKAETAELKAEMPEPGRTRARATTRGPRATPRAPRPESPAGAEPSPAIRPVAEPQGTPAAAAAGATRHRSSRPARRSWWPLSISTPPSRARPRWVKKSPWSCRPATQSMERSPPSARSPRAQAARGTETPATGRRERKQRQRKWQRLELGDYSGHDRAQWPSERRPVSIRPR